MTLREALLLVLPYVADEDDVDAAKDTGIALNTILERLAGQMKPVPSDRTVRRALVAMSDVVGHVGHTSGARWFKTEDTTMLDDADRMSANLAIALVALRRVAYRQLPAAVLVELEPRFADAEARLRHDVNNARARDGRSWASKILRIDGTQPVIFPPLDAQVYRNVTDALLRERKIAFSYQRLQGGNGKLNDYTLSPLALVDRAGVFYLIMWSAAKPGQRYMFRLDRMRDARVIEEAAERDASFDLDAYVETEKMFDFLPEPDVELKLRVYATTGKHARPANAHMLNEFQLSYDQRIDYADDGESFVLTATVKPSVVLRQFLQGLGDSVEVLAPASLREEFAERARLLATRYANETADA